MSSTHTVAKPELTGRPMLNLATCTKADILEYFNHGWNMYETLMASIKSEHYTHTPQRLRKALIFYLGHTASLFSNKLVIAGALKEEDRINSYFDGLFAVGVDEMSWDDLTPPEEWPSVESVWEYRQKVHDQVEAIIEATPLDLPIVWEKDTLWALVMGMEHEKIHLETSCVLIRESPVEYLVRPAGWTTAPTFGFPPQNTMVTIPAQTVTLGRPRDFPSYYWDNEAGTLVEEVKSFRVTKFKVTNAEWLGFINAKGYEQQSLWTEEGWSWRQFHQATHPHFWVPLDASKYRYRDTYEVIDMPWDWPVEVNFLEAQAYAKWKGMRLPTEAEFRALSGFPNPPVKGCDGTYDVTQDPVFLPLDKIPYNLNMKVHSSTPVTFYPPNHLGIYDALGNVWEHGTTTIDAFPGFKVTHLYLDFSTPTFDTRHTMIMGGNWISTGNEASVWSRYAFRRHFHQMVSFRLIEDLPEAGICASLSPAAVTAALSAEWAPLPPDQPLTSLLTGHPTLTNSYAAFAAHVVKALGANRTSAATVLDVGCRGGRLAFELAAQGVASVVGLDPSADLVAQCQGLARTGSLDAVKGAKIPLENSARVSFVAGPICPLDTTAAALKQPFDVVVSLNRLTAVPEPTFLLNSMARCVVDGGLLVIASAYEWDEAVTHRSKWLDVCGGATLRGVMADLGFELDQESEQLFAFAESPRSCSVQQLHTTFWRKRAADVSNRC